jgi:hypothetical protein
MVRRQDFFPAGERLLEFPFSLRMSAQAHQDEAEVIPAQGYLRMIFAESLFLHRNRALIDWLSVHVTTPVPVGQGKVVERHADMRVIGTKCPLLDVERALVQAMPPAAAQFVVTSGMVPVMLPRLV